MLRRRVAPGVLDQPVADAAVGQPLLECLELLPVLDDLLELVALPPAHRMHDEQFAVTQLGFLDRSDQRGTALWCPDEPRHDLHRCRLPPAGGPMLVARERERRVERPLTRSRVAPSLRTIAAVCARAGRRTSVSRLP